MSSKLQGFKIVTLTSSMTATQIQAIIDNLPKNLNGNTLLIQFSDGTYTLSSQLKFQGFFGGYLYIHGNSANGDTKSTTKNVTLNFNTSGNAGLYCYNCACTVNIRYLKVIGVGVQGLIAYYNVTAGAIRGNTIELGSSASPNTAIQLWQTGPINVYYNYTSSGYWAYYSSQGSIMCTYDNTSYGNCVYGYHAENAIILNYGGSTPGYTTAVKITSVGGQINNL